MVPLTGAPAIRTATPAHRVSIARHNLDVANRPLNERYRYVGTTPDTTAPIGYVRFAALWSGPPQHTQHRPLAQSKTADQIKSQAPQPDSAPYHTNGTLFA